MKNITKILIASLAIVGITTSCFKDLDRFPLNDTTNNEVYATFQGTTEAFAKIFGSLALTAGDIQMGDEGMYTGFVRTFFNLQTLPTDEAHAWWGDDGIPEMNLETEFTAANPFSEGLYARCLVTIMFVNDFLRNTTDGLVSERGFTEAQRTEIRYYRAEARFVRAFMYWVLMDLFGNPPFILEGNLPGELPQQIQRADLFDWVVTELRYLADNGLRAPGTNQFGRPDQAAAWALLARTFLNANVYTSPVGSPGNNPQFYTYAIYYASRVMEHHSLFDGMYEHLFLNDNYRMSAPGGEFIFSINFDGLRSRSVSGTTFLMAATSNAGYRATYRSTILCFGLIERDWGGYRTRLQHSELFEPNDRRFLFVGENPSLSPDRSLWENGLSVFKWRNIPSTMVVDGCQRTMDSDGNFAGCTVCGPNEGCYLFQRVWDEGRRFGNAPDGSYADNNFPVFRVAEMMLIYAEAVERGGNGGSQAQALAYMSQLRQRAGLSAITSYPTHPRGSLGWILDERGRELYWEGHRRTDLVRFNLFTSGDFLWEYKGGTLSGRALSPHLNIFPLPASDVAANRNLNQNDGYF
ncbi:MAG: RagB/SusD family nutrient uptake outer membrane protein [Bacteroidales bacterium]|nr:RagB/SusD family nutrient uptake outer membrane protein [Bacteroidales bacterium]